MDLLNIFLVSTAAVPIPPVSLNLTGCWEMGASNGRAPSPGCGTAPLDAGDGLIYLHQYSNGVVDACLSQACYRPAAGNLINTSVGTGMLRLQTLTGKGTCNSRFHKSFPKDGLLEVLEFVLPLGWPQGNATRGTHVAPNDIAGVFINDDNVAGTAGGIFLKRRSNNSACFHMRDLPDCTASPLSSLRDRHNTMLYSQPSLLHNVHTGLSVRTAACDEALEKVCGSTRGAGTLCHQCLEVPAHHTAIKEAGCTPPDVSKFCGAPSPGPSPPSPGPSPPPPEAPHNMTGCYKFGGSAGQQPGPNCGMAPATSG